MKIYTRIEIDMETGKVRHAESYDYSGPLALCDRSLVARAKSAQDQASQQAGAYGSQAAGIAGNITPTLERWTVNPPGFSPQAMANLKTNAIQAANARAGAAQEQSRLRALRTGNEAGLGALEAAEAQGGARAAGSTVEDILAKNEMLKAQQQREAMGELGNLYGSAMRGNVGSMEQEAKDIDAATSASQTGWLQNTMGVLSTLGKLGSYSRGGFTVGGGGSNNG